jgi:hypothetical protein
VKSLKLRGDATQKSNVEADMKMDGVEANDATQSVITRDEVQQLDSELTRILSSARATYTEGFATLDKVREAHEHVREGNAISAARVLRGVGKWGLKVATDLAAGVLVKFIEGSSPNGVRQTAFQTQLQISLIKSHSSAHRDLT